jgi:hypothetical protein
MPTSHKPINDHKPLNLLQEIERLEGHLKADFPDLIAIARKGKPLEDDEEEELRGQFFRSLFQFTTLCAARPVRSPNKLIGTLRDIERRPDEFIQDHAKYDPEAANMVFRHYGGRVELALFEIGKCSLAEHRKTVEGPESPVPDNLIRLSVGIEHVDDLMADIEQALG